MKTSFSSKHVTDQPYNVLFLGTGDSACAVIAEAVMNRMGQGKFKAYSAERNPKGEVNSHTLQLLQGLGFDTSGMRSKSCDEFTKPGAPEFDFVFTVCDNAVAEARPTFPGKPITANWSIPDPAAVKGSPAEIALAFKSTCRMLSQRINLFAALPITKLNEVSLRVKRREKKGGMAQQDHL
jgi:arsenate reductase